MLELIGLLATGAAAVGGYIKSRQFVRNRLSYVDAVHKSATPILAGTAAAVVAAPIVWVVPLVGTGTAILFGLGVGAGVAAGSRDSRRRLPG